MGLAKFRPRQPAAKCPSTIVGPGRKLWKELTEEYSIGDSAGKTLLQTVCQAETDIQRMRGKIATEGDTVKDRFGQVKAHPLLAAVRDAESTKRQALRALNLDLEPLKGAGPGRPPGR
jgi:P27 family predicted phage terminase small subunit